MPKKLPKRKNLRLPEYDYSWAGYYSVTICAKEKRCIFGEVVGAGVPTRPQIKLSSIGTVVDDLLSRMPSVDKYIVMPNHIHVIFRIQRDSEGGPLGTAAPTTTLPNLVHYLKRTASVQCGVSLWQRGYYEHVIRDEKSYLDIWQYIDENPAKWAEDEYFER